MGLEYPWIVTAIYGVSKIVAFRKVDIFETNSSSVLRNGLCYERPTHIKRCPIGYSLQKIVGHPKLVTLLSMLVIFKNCMAKIKTASDSRITGVRSDQRRSFDRAHWELSDVWILITASAPCSFWRSFDRSLTWFSWGVASLSKGKRGVIDYYLDTGIWHGCPHLC